MNIEQFVGYQVDDGVYTYYRFGKSAWYQVIGDSLESVYHDEDLEKRFQKQAQEDYENKN